MYVCDACNYIFTDKNDKLDIKSEPEETNIVNDSQPEPETSNKNRVEVSSYSLRRKTNKFTNYLALSKHGTTVKNTSKPTTLKERMQKKICREENTGDDDAATEAALETTDQIKCEEDQST